MKISIAAQGLPVHVVDQVNTQVQQLRKQHGATAGPLLNNARDYINGYVRGAAEDETVTVVAEIEIGVKTEPAKKPVVKGKAERASDQPSETPATK